MTAIHHSIIIGLAPAYECQPNQHCMGQFMRTICQISGLRYEEYLKRFGRLNLFPDPVGKSVMPPASACFDAATALVATLIRYFKTRTRAEEGWKIRLICAGTVSYHSIKQALEELRSLIPPTMDIYPDFVPHPSGRNRMLNNPEIRSQMAQKFQLAYAASTPLPESFYADLVRLSTVPTAVAEKPVGCRNE